MFHFPRFPPYILCIQMQATEVYSAGFPHSDILGSKVCCHLPETFRRLTRPSSALYCLAIHRTPLRAFTIRALIQKESAGWDVGVLFRNCKGLSKTDLAIHRRCLAHITF